MNLCWRLRTRLGDDVLVLPEWAKTSAGKSARAIPFESLDWLLGPFGIGRVAMLEMYRTVTGLAGESALWPAQSPSQEMLFSLKEAFRSGRLVAFKVPDVVARGPFAWSLPLPADSKPVDSPADPPPERDDWPTLEVFEVRFESIAVVKDGVADIGKEFPCRWRKGEADQPPLCCAAGSKLALEADFDVVTTVDAVVKIKAVADLGAGALLTWFSEVKVKAGQATASFTSVSSNEAIPPGVALHEPLKISWSMSDRRGLAWQAMGTTAQTLYVTMRPPTEGFHPYWTLLDISCRAGAGHTDESTFVPAAFQPFKNSTGDGNGIVRKGDGVRLSYYLQGSNTESGNSVQSTRGLLSRQDGTARCGAWGRLLIALLRIHGIESPRQLWMMRGQKYDVSKRFLVMNCSLEGKGTAIDFPGYTHKGVAECIKRSGVAGQGKTNPQFDFADHVVVEHDGNIYDPSYGVGPIGQRKYEELAIAGVGRIQFFGEKSNVSYFTMPDGTPQFMSRDCGRGFIEDEVTDERAFAAIAAFYKLSSAALFDHPYNADLKQRRVTPDETRPGDVVLIPRDMTPVPMLWARFLQPETFA